MPQWTPKYPDFSTRPSGGDINETDAGDEFTRKDQSGEYKPLEWVGTPDTSHVDSMAFESKNLNNPLFSKLRKIAGTSVLHVRFKPSGDRGRTHYNYLYDDDALGMSHFELLKAAEHPGQVVHDVLIAQKIPYVRVS